MTNTSNQILFFGTEEFSLAALRGLIDSGYPIAAVVTKPDSKKGRGQKEVFSKVKQLALEHNIPVWQPLKLRDIIDDIKALMPVTGVLVSYGKIIPQDVIDLFSPGIINVHPSLLPTYRGSSPIESAILHGNNQTGVSIMQLSSAMDAGPVYTAKAYPLDGTETQPNLYDKLSVFSTSLLTEQLPSILDGSCIPVAQDNAAATYCQLIKKSDGVIDFTQSAVMIERKIRAYLAWPQSRTTLGTVEVIVTAARATASPTQTAGFVDIIDEAAGILAVHTSDGLLYIDRLKPIGKKEMPVKAFLDGYIAQLS